MKSAISHHDVFAFETFLQQFLWDEVGSGCSQAVGHMPLDREVVGSNPDVYWAFFALPYPTSSASLIYIPRGGAILLIFLLKICLAVQLE